MLWMEYPPCLESKYTTATNGINVTSELFRFMNEIMHFSSPVKTSEILYQAWTRDFCDYRLTWMSLSHRLWSKHERAIFQQITHCDVFLWEIFGKLKRNAPQFPPTRLRQTGPLRQKWTDTGDTASSTKLQFWGHMAQYIYGCSNTRTHVHTRHVNPWDRPFRRGGGGVPINPLFGG